MEFDEMKDYGLDPNAEDYEEWLLSPEGRAVMEEMFLQGDDIKSELIAEDG